MPDPLALCHLLAALGALALLWALYQAFIWARHSSYGQGTPQYARARDGRRFAAWGLAAAILFFAIGCLTPVGDIPIS
jgi:hypothetical protein